MDVWAEPAPFTLVGVRMWEPYRLGDVEALRRSIGAEWLPDAEQPMSVQRRTFDHYREIGHVSDTLAYEEWRGQQTNAAWRVPMTAAEAGAAIEADPRVRRAYVLASPRIDDAPVPPPPPPLASPVEKADRSRPARLVRFYVPLPPRGDPEHRLRWADRRRERVRVSLFDRFGRERRVLYDEPTRWGEGERFFLDSRDLGPSLYFVRTQGETFSRTLPIHLGRENPEDR
jgi:hypothetical protein